MKKLTCEMCGSTDLVKQDGVFVCQFCGTKYSVEEAKKMMVEGPVEVVQGESEKERLLKNAEAYISLERFDEAMEVYSTVSKDYPDDYRGWWGSFCTYIKSIKASGQWDIETMEKPFLDLRSALKLQSELKTEYDQIAKDLIRDVSCGAIGPIWKHSVSLGTIGEEAVGSVLRPKLELLEQDDPLRGFFLEGLSSARHFRHLCEEAAGKISPNAIYQYGDEIFSSYITRDIWKEPTASFSHFSICDLIMVLGRVVMCLQFDTSPYADRYYATTAILSDDLENIQDQMLSELEQQGKTGCYVATAIYGSYDCPQVWTLRRYRDFTLAETWYGRAFIRAYYAVSPTLVKWFGDTQWFKNLWKPRLDRLVAKLNENGVADSPYQDKDW